MAIQVLGAVASDLWTAFVAFVPNLVGALILLSVGFVVGRIVGKVVREVLVRLNADVHLRKEAHLKFRASVVGDLIARWVIYLLFIQASSEVLGIASIVTFVANVLFYVPSFVAAAVVLLIAYAIGIYFKEEIVSSRSFYSDLTGKAIFFLTLYLGLSVALRIVNVPLVIVDQILLILVASVGLGLAIALGLGLKDVIREIASDYETRMKRRK